MVWIDFLPAPKHFKSLCLSCTIQYMDVIKLRPSLWGEAVLFLSLKLVQNLAVNWMSENMCNAVSSKPILKLIVGVSRDARNQMNSMLFNIENTGYARGVAQTTSCHVEPTRWALSRGWSNRGEASLWLKSGMCRVLTTVSRLPVEHNLIFHAAHLGHHDLATTETLTFLYCDIELVECPAKKLSSTWSACSLV